MAGVDYGLELACSYGEGRYLGYVAPANHRWVVIVKDLGITIRKWYVLNRDSALRFATCLERNHGDI